MALRTQKIWITRAQPGADETAGRVRALGHEAVVVPLLTVETLPAELDLAGVGALAFTSANGVRAYGALTAERKIKVFAVGAATAQAARQIGFREVLSANGDVAALAEGIASRRREISGKILSPGAEEPAGDLVGDLTARGIDAERLSVYGTCARDLVPQDLEALQGADAVLLHSPKAARALACELLKHPMPGLRALGLSAAVLRPLEDSRLAGRNFAPFPLEAGLLNLIDR